MSPITMSLIAELLLALPLLPLLVDPAGAEDPALLLQAATEIARAATPPSA
jgi:hypothetical protein